MKRNLIIAGVVTLLITAGVVLFLRTLPDKLLQKEVAALDLKLGSTITYDKVEYDSQFFPREIKLHGFTLNKSSIYGDLSLVSKLAQITIVNDMVDEITLSGMEMMNNLDSKTTISGAVGAGEVAKIATDEKIIIDVGANKGELFAIQFPQKFEAHTAQYRSHIQYVGKAPIVSLVFNNKGQLQILDYQDNGIEVETKYEMPGMLGIVQTSTIEPIKILYKEEEEKEAIHTRFEVKAALPKKAQTNIQELANLTDKQKQDLSDVLFFNNLGIEIGMSIYGDKTSHEISFVKLEKFDFLSDNFAINLTYNGGIIKAGSKFPNGSGNLLFSNYREFFTRLARIYQISQDLAESGDTAVGNEMASYFMLAGSGVSDFSKTVDNIITLLHKVNDSDAVKDFYMEYAFVPPFTFVLNDKNLEELLSIWSEIEADSAVGDKPEEGNLVDKS